MAVSPAVQNLIISLVMMQVARKIPFDDPTTLRHVRIAYVLAQAFILALYYYTSIKINRKNDQSLLKYVEPPSPWSQEQGKLVTTTVRDYDLMETSKLLRSAYTGILLMAYMHGYLHYTQPLFIQAVMGLKNVWDAKTVAIYVLGRPATGDLKRPFKASSIFGAAAAAQGPQTDAAAINEAEKRVGAKKEEF